ncbi:CHAD domain-containing protein [Pseudomonas sp. Marseille-Q8238]
MSAVLKTLGHQVLRLHVRLYACRARLEARTDGEALHDLRIAVRTLRSLLRPFRRDAACARLEQAAAVIGRSSSGLRDLEVLIAELQRQGKERLLPARQQALQEGYERLLASEALGELFAALDDWPRDAVQAPVWRKAGKRLHKHLLRQSQRLALALVDPESDKHGLRLLIKRLRYAGEAYPDVARFAPAVHKRLRAAQSATGNWHDLLQWLARVPNESDLHECAADWQRRLQVAEQAADQALLVLRLHFPGLPDGNSAA